MSDPGAGSTDVRQLETRGVLPVGTRLRGYEILSVLGQGGFGVTYRARDTTLGRDVAIKEYLPTSLAVREDGTMVVPRSTEQAEEFVWGRDRFLEEARTLARLDSAPAIVRVYDFLEANGTAYMIMALLDGESLERRLKRDGPLSPAAIERLIYPLLDGLEAVHASGFLHRDIKPDNIMLDTKGSPTLIDFGASRAAMAGRTTAMTAIFTPGYAAAEQFTSAKQGPWTDVYGLSATLYRVVTGHTPPSAFDRMLDDEYQPLAKLLPAGISSGIIIGIDAGLAVRAENRPQSIADWRAVLSAPGSINPNVAVSLGRDSSLDTTILVRKLPTAPTRPAKSKSGLWIALAVVAAIVLSGGGYYVATSRPAPPPTSGGLSIPLAAAAADAEKAAQERAAEEARSRQQERDELARLRAEAAAREKAEREAALRREIEEQTRRRLEAELAEKKRLEDEARQKADAEAATKRKAEESDRGAAEAAETALRLTNVDRQHAQVALTSLGFNTGGTDGTFGARSREMIGAWQKAHNQPATGFLSGTHNQALLREAAAAVNKYDEEQKKKLEDEAKPKPAPAAPVATTPPTSSATPPASTKPSEENPPLETKQVTAYKLVAPLRTRCEEAPTYMIRVFPNWIELRIAGAWRTLKPDSGGKFVSGEFESLTSGTKLVVTGSMSPRTFDVKNLNSGCIWRGSF